MNSCEHRFPMYPGSEHVDNIKTKDNELSLWILCICCNEFIRINTKILSTQTDAEIRGVKN